MLWTLLVSGIFLISGLALLNFALRKRTPREKMLGKELPLTGRGGKVDLVYIALGLIGIALYAMLQNVN
jgi:hypothetical protein